jgi:hypothetical protein
MIIVVYWSIVIKFRIELVEIVGFWQSLSGSRGPQELDVLSWIVLA